MSRPARLGTIRSRSGRSPRRRLCVCPILSHCSPPARCAFARWPKAISSRLICFSSPPSANASTASKRTCRSPSAGRCRPRAGARIRHAAARPDPVHGRRCARCDAGSCSWRWLPPSTCRTMPARALVRTRGADAAARDAMVRAVLADAIPVEALADHVYRRGRAAGAFRPTGGAARSGRLVPVGDGVCPACGGPPVASVIVGWQGADGTRFCTCSLCATQWNLVRIKCVLCGSTKGIAYQESRAARIRSRRKPAKIAAAT